MDIILHTDASLFETLQPEWNALVMRSIANTPFSTWEWNSTWWQAYQPGALWVLTARQAGALVGIAPCFIENHPQLGRVLRYIGHIDVTDYLDLIVHEAHQTDVYNAFAAFLAQQTDAFDHIGIANMRSGSPTPSALQSALESHGFSVSFEQNDVAPYITLPADYDTYVETILSSKERKETKRKMRRAEGGEYRFAWYIVDTSHDLDAELDKFLKLMHSADQDKALFLQNAQHVAFFKAIMPLMHANGWLQLSFITIDDEPSAAYLSFDYNNIIYVYNSGLEPNKFGALSPGIVLLQYIIQHAIEQHRTTFDFLRGNESYKYKMGATDAQVTQLNAHKA